MTDSEHSIWFSETHYWFHRVDQTLHRIDGPAVIYPDGREEFWIDGKQYGDPNEYWRLVKMKAFW